MAPISTDTSIPPISSLIIFEISSGPSSSNSIPLISETARQPGAIPVIFGHVRARNWCGITKTSIVASFTALVTSGSAITFSVNLMPGRYLTFSWSPLITSVSLRVSPPTSTSSSKTHIRTSGSNPSFISRLRPMIFAIAEPQLPEPMIATFSLV